MDISPTTVTVMLWILGVMLAVIGALVVWAWNHTHALITTKADSSQLVEVMNKMGKKADASQLNEVIGQLDRIYKTNREDTAHIFHEIAKVVDAHVAFTQKTIEELGKRPTRDEYEVMHRARAVAR